MFPLRCILYCSSTSEHLTQIFAGFGELVRRRIAKVNAVRLPNYRGDIYGGAPLLKVRLNDRCNLLYDVSDSFHIPRMAELATADFYFKRSYRPDYLASVPHANRVFPLGLNYSVFSDYDFGIRRAFWATSWRDFLEQIVRSTPLLARLLRVQGSISTAYLQRFEGTPNDLRDPTVLFMATVWEPTKASSPEVSQELWNMAAMRAECVRRLRKEFGSRFVGGLQASEFTKRHFPDCMLTNQTSSRKDHYLEVLKDAAIGIATAGLHESIGWKLAEYVAGAKAIVSEELKCVLPGGFAAGKNYLEFSNPEQCVAAAVELVEDRAKRYEMMKNNFLYYWNWLRPDVLVLNTLLTALTRTDTTMHAGDAHRIPSS